MAKNVYWSTEIINKEDKVSLKPPVFKKEEDDLVETAEEYTGPTADDLRREAEAFKVQWEKEKEALINAARAEAEQIKSQAEETAFNEVKKKTEEAKREKEQAVADKQAVLDEAEEKARGIVAQAEEKAKTIEKEARDSGYQNGHEEGFAAGKEEVGRLVDRLNTILSTAINKRNQIIDESETQLINLVLLVARKVVKVISENQKNVVINNVVQALRKLKSRGDVAIRVNLADLELTTENTKEFMRMVENVNSITILEDSTVERGGCIIETDFGEIDARINSQLKEIEDKITELMPITVRNGAVRD